METSMKIGLGLAVLAVCALAVAPSATAYQLVTWGCDVDGAIGAVDADVTTNPPSVSVTPSGSGVSVSCGR